MSTHADADAILVVYVPRLIEDVKAAAKRLRQEKKVAPDTVVMDQWHFDCLLAWHVENCMVPETSQTLIIDRMLVYAGAPERHPFVLARRDAKWT